MTQNNWVVTPEMWVKMQEDLRQLSLKAFFFGMLSGVILSSAFWGPAVISLKFKKLTPEIQNVISRDFHH